MFGGATFKSELGYGIHTVKITGIREVQEQVFTKGTEVKTFPAHVEIKFENEKGTKKHLFFVTLDNTGTITEQSLEFLNRTLANILTQKGIETGSASLDTICNAIVQDKKPIQVMLSRYVNEADGKEYTNFEYNLNAIKTIQDS